MVQNLDNSSSQSLTMRQKHSEDFARCSNCSFSYFEEVEIHHINKHAVVTIGQKTAKSAPGPFIFLRCAKCMTLHEPNLTSSTHQANVVYAELKAELEKEDKKAKEPEVSG